MLLALDIFNILFFTYNLYLMNNTELLSVPLAEIVKSNFRTSKVMERYGLDFCCNGKRTLAEACTEKAIPIADVVNDLQSLVYTNNYDTNFDEFSLTHLVDHIVNIHHHYVREQMPLIHTYLDKVNSKHGDRYPYMKQVAETFFLLCNDLEAHLKREEEIVFPIIKDLEANNSVNGELTLVTDAMEDEHTVVGALLLEIRNETKNYQVPEQACTTFSILLHLLKEFETDLHKHVYLENHILFPKAKKLAKNKR
jgi:regulator of cell morphogenesis and NO signaling